MKRAFVAAMIVTLSMLSGCEKAEELWQSRMEKAGEAKSIVSGKRKELRELQYRTMAILLAMKYRVDEDTVFDMLSDRGLGWVHKLLNIDVGAIRDPETWLEEVHKKERQRIVSWSERYKIPTDLIASILIDYYAMTRPVTLR